MTNVNYPAVASFSVSATYLQASQLPPTKPSGLNLTRLANLQTALLAVMAADNQMAARTTPPVGGKQYMLISSSEAWTACNTVLAAVNAIIGGQTGATVT